MQNFNLFEKLLALHCAPTFCRIKPSNLISLQKDHLGDINYLVKEYNTIFEGKDIFLDILCECKNYYLILVYNRSLLIDQLNEPYNKEFLKKYGYTLSNLDESINLLKFRTPHVNKFPHEIGVFLGYPLEDVIGFIENKGNDYKFFGYWKVYSDESLAKELFKKYTTCREFFCEKIIKGMTLLQILDSI